MDNCIFEKAYTMLFDEFLSRIEGIGKLYDKPRTKYALSRVAQEMENYMCRDNIPEELIFVWVEVTYRYIIKTILWEKMEQFIADKEAMASPDSDNPMITGSIAKITEGDVTVEFGNSLSKIFADFFNDIWGNGSKPTNKNGFIDFKAEELENMARFKKVIWN